MDCFPVGAESQGHWYGGGESLHAAWPLEKGAIKLSAFVTGDEVCNKSDLYANVGCRTINALKQCIRPRFSVALAKRSRRNNNPVLQTRAALSAHSFPLIILFSNGFSCLVVGRGLCYGPPESK